MASTGLQILGVTLALIGWISAIITCALPMWRVTAFIGKSIVVVQIIWEGRWMNCIMQSTGHMQCEIYDSMLALPQDLQVACALCVISILIGILALLTSIVGAKCTNCVEEELTKAKISMVSGIIFVITSVLMLIPVCWSVNTMIRDFYNAMVTDAQKGELGAALYIGWAAAALLLLGGALLCCGCPKRKSPSRPGKPRPAPSPGATTPPRTTCRPHKRLSYWPKTEQYWPGPPAWSHSGLAFS